MTADSGDGSGARTYVIGGDTVVAPALPTGLYVVATPIGNLADVTLRALSTLAAADIVACEDTRVSAVLLRRYGIIAKLAAYHDHNAERERPKLLAALAAGKSVALVSDAGTPLISDPGYKLVAEARAAGHAVFPIPGASSVMAALVASGLPTDSFLFCGFLPPKTVARKKKLAEIAGVRATLVFFESPQRLGASLADMAEVLGGDRAAATARELTKAFETVRAGSLSELAAAFAGDPPKGEIVVVVGPPPERTTSPEDADALLATLLKSHSVNDAATAAAAATGLPRRDLYRRALELKAERE